jgi:hypothetical protein
MAATAGKTASARPAGAPGLTVADRIDVSMAVTFLENGLMQQGHFWVN